MLALLLDGGSAPIARDPGEAPLGWRSFSKTLRRAQDVRLLAADSTLIVVHEVVELDRHACWGVRKEHRISSWTHSVILPEHCQVARSPGVRGIAVGTHGGDFGAPSGERNEETCTLEAGESRVFMQIHGLLPRRRPGPLFELYCTAEGVASNRSQSVKRRIVRKYEKWNNAVIQHHP